MNNNECDAVYRSFSKIAKELFDPRKAPPISNEQKSIDAARDVRNMKMKGMSPVEYRRSLTEKNKGVLSRNAKTTPVR